MTSGKENNIIELNGKPLKWTQKLVLKFLAAIKREKQNYQYLMTGNRKGLPLQDSFLIYFPAISFPPTIATVLRQRSWYTLVSHFLHLTPASPACSALCPSPVSLILTAQLPGSLHWPRAGWRALPHSESNMCFPQIHLLSHSIIFVSLSVFPTGQNAF